jgi:hypothetical protein
VVGGAGASAAGGGEGELGAWSSYAGAAGGRVGPDAAVGEAVYAGGGSLEGTVKAFMPGRFGRLVGGDGPLVKIGDINLVAVGELVDVDAAVGEVVILGVVVGEGDNLGAELILALLVLLSFRIVPIRDFLRFRGAG